VIVTNISECIPGYCINGTTSGTTGQFSCKKINATEGIYGRDSLTFKCIVNENVASTKIDFCASGYCIYSMSSTQQQCRALSSFPADASIGKELTSGRCLTIGESSELGVSECATNACLFQTSTTSQECRLLSNDPTLHSFGVEAGSGKCLDIDEPTTKGLNTCSSKTCKYTYDGGLHYTC